ncbi:MAG: aspartyl protease family protein, partial [Chloroflexi bacterium]|nr:aspartyl protease family protein [Chloroflexota bacterium]
ALADTGATTTVIPASVLGRLGITPTQRKTFEYADGNTVELDMAPV